MPSSIQISIGDLQRYSSVGLLGVILLCQCGTKHDSLSSPGAGGTGGVDENGGTAGSLSSAGTGGGASGGSPNAGSGGAAGSQATGGLSSGGQAGSAGNAGTAGDSGGAGLANAGTGGMPPGNVLKDSFDNIPGWDRQGVVMKQDLSWETALLQDPCLVYQQGGGATFKLWYGSLQNIGYATSADGLTWTKNPDPVVKQTLPTETGALNQPSVVYKDGVYHMTYFGVDGSGEGRVHYAEATDPAGPWTKYGPVLSSEFDWENKYIYNSSLMYDEAESIWKMWYTAGKIASAGGEPEFICYATAMNPRGPWTKYAGNPLVSPMSDGGWASLGIGGPNVRKLQDGSYEMVVVGWQADYPSRGGLVKSTDGIHWSLARSNMTLDLGVVGGPEDAMIYREFPVNVGGVDYDYYNAKNNRPGWNETINLAIWKNDLAIIDPSKWSMGQGAEIPNGASFAVLGGKAQSLGNAASGHLQTLQGNRLIPARDYALTADVQPLSSAAADRDNVLLVRYTDRSNFYYAGVASWGSKYAIGKMVNGTNSKLTSVGSASDIAQGTTYHLRVVVTGLAIELYDNDTLVLSTKDPSLSPTQSYVGLQTTSSIAQAAFDNVSVDLLGPN